MRVLIINPNTTEAMTAKVAAAARHMLPAADMTAVSGRFGPRYIASRAAFAVASHAALDAWACHGADADVVLLACFGDPGLDALREMSVVPVIGLVEASAAEAGTGGRRFSIVTGGVLWEPMLRESLATRGHSGQLASIRTVAPNGAAIAADPEGSLRILGEACDACVREDGADVVILGGAGLIGLAEKLAASRTFPVICSVMAGLRAAAEALQGEGRQNSSRRLPAPEPVDSIGLSADLSMLLLRPRAS